MGWKQLITLDWLLLAQTSSQHMIPGPSSGLLRSAKLGVVGIVFVKVENDNVASQYFTYRDDNKFHTTSEFYRTVGLRQVRESEQEIVM